MEFMTKEGLLGKHKDPNYKANHAKLPRSKYVIQKAQAKARGIVFDLTFEQWWSLWLASGQWENRGRKPLQYCMSRVNDAGGYSVGNVEIKQVDGNAVEQLHSGKHVSLKLAGSDVSTIVFLGESVSQKEIAASIGVSQPHVSRILNGKRGKYLKTKEG